jgi:hypothetical protein
MGKKSRLKRERVKGRDQWKHGLQMIQRGVYVDKRGAMHIDDAELLTAHGYAVTEENAAMLRQAAREMGKKVIEVEDE